MRRSMGTVAVGITSGTTLVILECIRFRVSSIIFSKTVYFAFRGKIWKEAESFKMLRHL